MKSKKYDKKTILLVEDDEQTVRVLAKKLERENLLVLLAKNGKDGLATCFKNHPDLILLDIIIPEMDGVEMLKRLRQDEWGKTARVIVLTNLIDPEKEAEISKQKVKNFLIKTEWSIDQIIDIIKKELVLS